MSASSDALTEKESEEKKMMNINRSNLTDMVIASEWERLSTLNYEEYEQVTNTIYHSDENELFQDLMNKIISIFAKLENNSHKPIYIGNSDCIKFTTKHDIHTDALTGEPWEIINQAFSIYGLYDISYDYTMTDNNDISRVIIFNLNNKSHSLIYDIENESYYID